MLPWKQDAFDLSVAQRKAYEAKIKMVADRVNRNGITLEDLQTAEKLSYDRGFNESSTVNRKMYSAAIVDVLHTEFGFGHQRLMRVLRAMGDKITNCYDGEEYVKEIQRKYGFKLVFKGDPEYPFENVTET